MPSPFCCPRPRRIQPSHERASRHTAIDDHLRPPDSIGVGIFNSPPTLEPE